VDGIGQRPLRQAIGWHRTGCNGVDCNAVAASKLPKAISHQRPGKYLIAVCFGGEMKGNDT
jgi:hypothetical protein